MQALAAVATDVKLKLEQSTKRGGSECMSSDIYAHCCRRCLLSAKTKANDVTL